MSKKTRKKSPKPASTKPARAQTTRSAKTPPSKTRLTTATKSGKNISKQPRKTIAGASHKPASKTLKSPGRSASAVRVAAAVAKPAVAPAAAKNPPAKKPPGVKASPPAARTSVLSEGAKAPAFRLPRDGGDTVSLADYSGKKLVLFFYPRADTPGCTKEAIDFTRLANAFAESQTAVLGVSADPPKAQEAFRDKHELTTPLVSDEQHEMLQAYGVWGEKSMYGRTFHGILRTTVLIGADGRVIRIWRNVKVDGHVDEVLAAVRAL
jgi:thioredoxin-dependent peroxiredoxin